MRIFQTHTTNCKTKKEDNNEKHQHFRGWGIGKGGEVLCTTMTIGQ